MKQEICQYFRALDETTLFQLAGVATRRARAFAKTVETSDQVNQLTSLLDLADGLNTLHREKLTEITTARSGAKVFDFEAEGST